MIRSAAPTDAEKITGIYNHYIVNTPVTFEEELVLPEQIAQRMADILAESLPWLVFERDGTILGYAYATKWRTRSAYRFSVETSVYLDHAAVGGGIGSKLYEALFAELSERKVHAVIGGITLPNEASIALHEKFGMKKVAHFNEVGFKFGRWLDVGYWERLL
ncbi:MAG: arsinothricin resistance N-acetyltransferase ArsN1 family B [Bdellovibrionota bacterium]